MGRVQNKTVIVTGAASGIGLEVARRMADEGANVVVADLRAGMVESVAQEIGDTAHAISLDVREDESLRHLMARTLDHFGRIDVLVNNAGILRRTPAHECSDEDWDDVINTNLTGTFRFCREVGKVMLGQGRGKIINIASLLSFSGGINPHISPGFDVFLILCL